MSRDRREMRVTPRPGLLNPESRAIHSALHSLGWKGAEDVRVGEAIDVDLACEAGLLAEALIRNTLLHFESREVYLRVERSDSMFTDNCETGRIPPVPIAHGEGSYEGDTDTPERAMEEVLGCIDGVGPFTSLAMHLAPAPHS